MLIKLLNSKDFPEDIQEEFDSFKESVDYAKLKKSYKENEKIR